jgi:hypothetical protein
MSDDLDIIEIYEADPLFEPKQDEHADAWVMTIGRGRNGKDRGTIRIGLEHLEVETPNGVTMALAREMIATCRVIDRPWRAVGLDGKTRLMGNSLHRIAMLTVNNKTRIVLWGTFSVEGEKTVKRKCDECREEGHFHKEVCICCATLAAHGGRKPSERRQTRRRPAEENPFVAPGTS